MSNRDDFSKGVREVLAHRAGFRCSKPDCRASTAGPSSDSDKYGSIGIAAHITAAAPGGPRYDANLSSPERGATSNGIWLCDNHAREVDRDSNQFTVHMLRAWKVHAEDEARALLGRPTSGLGLDVAIELSLHRDAGDGLLIVGETNLPDGTKLMGDLRGIAPFSYHGQAKCSVNSRRFALGPFARSGSHLPQRWYKVQLHAHFNKSWNQPSHVIDMAGERGRKLVGKFARPLDPELDESDYAIDASFDCIAPSPASELALSPDEVEGSTLILQKTFIPVTDPDDLPSAKSVGDTVRSFMKFPGLRERDGWQARLVLPGIVEVTYSFWNDDRPEIATWHVMPRANEVRFRNRFAKWMSWTPPY